MAHRPAFLPMTLRQLKIFDTVFRHLHVTNASKELRISLAFSLAIRDLFKR